MTFIFRILMFAFFTTVAHATDFQTTLKYCNNLPSDSSNCPSSNVWQGVQLKGLKSISLPIESQSTFIQLEDEAGNIWTQSLETCRTSPSSIRGCLIKVDLTKPDEKLIRVSLWDIKKPQRNLTLFVDGTNQLSVLSDDGNHFIFSLDTKGFQ